MNDKTPTFNLKAVVRETGLKPDTLRAWERRYGVPSPDRTDSGHRLYSQHDIDTLKWLLERQQEGMSISRAVELWHRLEEDGTDPLQAAVTPGSQRAAIPTPVFAKHDTDTLVKVVRSPSFVRRGFKLVSSSTNMSRNSSCLRPLPISQLKLSVLN